MSTSKTQGWNDVARPDPGQQEAVARFCEEHGADPLRHVDIVDGLPRLNAEFQGPSGSRMKLEALPHGLGEQQEVVPCFPGMAGSGQLPVPP